MMTGMGVISYTVYHTLVSGASGAKYSKRYVRNCEEDFAIDVESDVKQMVKEGNVLLLLTKKNRGVQQVLTVDCCSKKVVSKITIQSANSADNN
ncbi:hypothetical protein EDM53_04530 [Rickettsiales endosymbiont of Peranema trichophorum]|nr:hypothetical protein EDM53_04530 [Rickettsiales endosymbiont of Peranema trichophorum]